MCSNIYENNHNFWQGIYKDDKIQQFIDAQQANLVDKCPEGFINANKLANGFLL